MVYHGILKHYLKYTNTYNYNENTTYLEGAYMNTGYKIDWNKDFTIEEKVNIQETDKRIILIGNF